MKHVAEQAWINRVDNGFVVTLRAYGTKVMLVARGQDELFGVLAEVDWIGSLRPLPPEGAGREADGAPGVTISGGEIPVARHQPNPGLARRNLP